VPSGSKQLIYSSIIRWSPVEVSHPDPLLNFIGENGANHKGCETWIKYTASELRFYHQTTLLPSFNKIMHSLQIWMNKLQVEPARARAIAIANSLTARSAEMMPWVFAKVRPVQQTVPKSAWGSVLERLQKPVVLPSILVYLVAFLFVAHIVLSVWVLSRTYSSGLKEWVSKCKLAWDMYMWPMELLTNSVYEGSDKIWFSQREECEQCH